MVVVCTVVVVVVVVEVRVTGFVVNGVLFVVKVEASVEVVTVCTDSFPSLCRTNPGGKMFDTSS